MSPASASTERLIIAHSVLLALAPFIQSAAGIPGGWTDATMLVVLFVAGPVAGLLLWKAGRDRTGAILMLAFMSAATYMHVDMMLRFMDAQDPEQALSASAAGLQVLQVLLIIVGSFGSLLSFALLRSIHSADAALNKEDAS